MPLLWRICPIGCAGLVRSEAPGRIKTFNRHAQSGSPCSGNWLTLVTKFKISTAILTLIYATTSASCNANTE